MHLRKLLISSWLAEMVTRVSLSPFKASPLGKRKGKELSAGLPKKPRLKIGEMSLTAVVELWKPEFSAIELGRQVTVVDSTQDHDTIVALAQAIMLPNDIAALSEEDNEMMRSLLVKQHVQSLQREMAISDRMVEHSTELKRAKKKMGSLESELKKAKLRTSRRVNRARDNYTRQVVEVHSDSFLQGWLACLAELGVPEDNPTWTKAAPALGFPEPPASYSPMVQLGFDEEKYVNRLDEDVPEPILTHVVALVDEVANLKEEVGEMIAEVSKEGPN
ncbi:hypothetical protein Acr_25g0001380 [Actinidia rufa]|uniref:P-loop containing nucleoside triphosphate hydrolases superfamily protein n=1 Tax=Actinidia rufa TaxID=165716 RepID=A0A7J0GY25_9ERIC|nr:hypothetical protein Acr_25g0001380 [Actinidia rufa]